MRYLFLLVMLTSSFIFAGEKEFRGIWLRPPDNVNDIPVMLDKIKETGFNAVFVETFYQGFTITDSSLMPTRSEYINKNILGKFVEEGHKRGLEIHAWIETYYWQVDVDKYKQFPKSPLLEQNPELVLKLKGNRETWDAEPAHRFANPAHPKVKEMMLKYVEEILKRFMVDGLHFDYVRYPAGDEDAGYDDFSLKTFKDETNINALEIQKGTKDWEIWVEWRENQVTGLLKEIRNLQKATNRNAVISTAMFPEYYKGRYTKDVRMQNWYLWVKTGLVDFLTPMAYSSTYQGIKDEIQEVVKWAGKNFPIAPGLAARKQTSDIYSSNKQPVLSEQIPIVRELGLKGHVVFCYGWLEESTGFGELKTKMYNQK